MTCSSEFPILCDEAIGRWSLLVEDTLATGREGQRHLFGGMGLAAAVMASERLTGRAALWHSVQFLAPVAVGTTLELAGAITSAGRSFDHVELRGTVLGRAVLTATGTCGRGAPSPAAQPLRMPTVPPPHACPEVVAHRDAHSDVHSTLEIRSVRGRLGIFSRDPVTADGRVWVWMRHRRRANDRAALAAMSDFIPSVASNALDMRAGGNSLDNHIRYCGDAESDWILCSFAIDHIGGGVGSGHAQMFAEDGTLVATASQTFRLRAIPRAEEKGEKSPAVGENIT